MPLVPSHKLSDDDKSNVEDEERNRNIIADGCHPRITQELISCPEEEGKRPLDTTINGL